MQAKASTTSSDYAVIRNVRIDFDSIVNRQFLERSVVQSLREAFLANEPFPHIVIDGLFLATFLELVHGEFDRVAWTDWDRYDSDDERKRGSGRHARFGNATQLYFNTIHSRPFLHFIEQVTGMEGLLPDPHLFGGGMHEIPEGGRFSVHVDFNQHPVTGLDNRLVFITYLNKDWQRSYGGALELWDFEKNVKTVDVDPLFGRSILFCQSPRTLHGHPVPVSAPQQRPRRSVAAYFYSNGQPDGESGPYRTTRFASPETSRSREAVVRGIKYVLPPVLLDAARTIRARLRSRG
jgi:Rps23 Pro-64 3,4-dihydroxylase Tpa1-like proline 4-hydroxylase